MSKYRNSLFYDFKSRFLVIFFSNYWYRFVLKYRLPITFVPKSRNQDWYFIHLSFNWEKKIINKKLMNKEFFSIVQNSVESHKRIRGGSRTAATSKMQRFVKKRSTLDVAVALDPPLRTFKARTKPVQNPYKTRTKTA